jgi:hypothetical protein
MKTCAKSGGKYAEKLRIAWFAPVENPVDFQRISSG